MCNSCIGFGVLQLTTVSLVFKEIIALILILVLVMLQWSCLSRLTQQGRHKRLMKRPMIASLMHPNATWKNKKLYNYDYLSPTTIYTFRVLCSNWSLFIRNNNVFPIFRFLSIIKRILYLKCLNFICKY